MKSQEINTHNTIAVLTSEYSHAENAILLELSTQNKEFIRQFPIGSYKADFYFPENNLVLEVDGSEFHSSPEQLKHDKIRNEYMNSLGFGVLRITGKMAKENPSGIVGLLKYLKGDTTKYINSESDIKDLYTSLLAERICSLCADNHECAEHLN